MTLIIKAKQLITVIIVPCSWVNFARIDVIENLTSNLGFAVSLLSSITPAGKSINVTNKETVMPAIIIQPKVMTGRILHSKSEPKPAMVVSPA